MIVRVSTPRSEFVAPVYQALRPIDAEVRPDVRTLQGDFERYTRDLRLLASVAAGAGSIALTLAVTGVFGLAAFLVEQRVGEIGLRIAVGASGVDIIRLMVQDSVRPVLLGTLSGVGLAVPLGHIMARIFYGVSGHHPVVLIGAAGVLIGAATVAAGLRTRRLARLDPLVALQRR